MRIHSILVGCTVAASACAGGITDDTAGAPSLLAASRTEVAVGQPLEFIGQNYLGGNDGHTELWFQGEYMTE